ncbi:MAG: class I SAM-dependent methyltransferase [Candidatus Competibacter denitrificans]
MTKNKPHDNYNVLAPDSIATRIAYKARLAMFSMFMKEFDPIKSETILDVGVTSDIDYSTSNYFEDFYPFKDMIICCGLDNASFLEKKYPGILFILANGLSLPFKDQSFDYIHSSAVIEHIGPFKNQIRLIRECARVAKKGFCITTPNRWFPIEFHTGLLLIHWLPKPLGRKCLRYLGLSFHAEESNLNLMTKHELKTIAQQLPQFRYRMCSYRLFGWKSNLILFGIRQKAETNNHE